MSLDTEKERRESVRVVKMIFSLTPPKHCRDPEFNERVKSWSEDPTIDEIIRTYAWATVKGCISEFVETALLRIMLSMATWDGSDLNELHDRISAEIDTYSDEDVGKRFNEKDHSNRSRDDRWKESIVQER